MRIAVFGNENSNISDFFEARRFVIWEKAAEGWHESGIINFTQITPSTPPQIRAEMTAILQLVADCEIIAGGALTGIPYVVFDQGGKHIFQIDEVSGKVLDEIIHDVTNERHKSPVLSPEEKSPGVFHFNLIDAQRENPGISSKQALLGFMETTPFAELHLVCMHIPPWIEKDFNVQQEGVSCKITPK